MRPESSWLKAWHGASNVRANHSTVRLLRLLRCAGGTSHRGSAGRHTQYICAAKADTPSTAASVHPALSVGPGCRQHLLHWLGNVLHCVHTFCWAVRMVSRRRDQSTALHTNVFGPTGSLVPEPRCYRGAKCWPELQSSMTASLLLTKCIVIHGSQQDARGQALSSVTVLGCRDPAFAGMLPHVC